MCKVNGPSYLDIYKREFALEKLEEIGQRNRLVPSNK